MPILRYLPPSSENNKVLPSHITVSLLVAAEYMHSPTNGGLWSLCLGRGGTFGPLAASVTLEVMLGVVNILCWKERRKLCVGQVVLLSVFWVHAIFRIS